MIAGGNSILLDKDYYTEFEKEILIAHGINPNNAHVPENITKACINIAKNCSREIGAICGMYFIYDAEERKWKYLEEHEFPMLYSYAEKYGLSYNVNTNDFYTIQQLLDIKS